MKLVCQFCIEDMVFPCKTPIPLPNKEKDSCCVWMDPFQMDGLKLSSELKVKFCIQTAKGFLVDMFCIYLELKHLSFSKQMYSIKNKRSSVHNVSKYVSPRSDNINSIQIDNVEVSYVADRFNDLIRLRITSVLARISPEFVQRFTSRKRIRLTAKLNDKELYKSNTVFLTENQSKLFSWIFDPDSKQKSLHVIHNVGEYDCDLDQSDENNITRLQPVQVTKENNLQIELRRDVFFPTDTGFEPKYLCVNLQELDFKAAIKLHKKESLYTLERGLRLGILLKIRFDKNLIILRMDVLIDDYLKTVEEYFNL